MSKPFNAFQIQRFLNSAKHGSLCVVEDLLKEGMDPDQSHPESKRTALINAAYEGHLEIVELLIKAGANVNMQESWGNTALACAAISGYEEIVKKLIAAHAYLDTPGFQDNTALSYAAELETNNITKMLVEAGADINFPSGYNNPLFVAARHGRLETVKYLISKGANVNIADESGNPLLVCLIENLNFCRDESQSANMESIFRLLIEAGANVNAVNAKGENALIPCVRGTHINLINLLLLQKININAKTTWGGTALMQLFNNCNKKVPEIATMLIKAGADCQNADVIKYAAYAFLRNPESETSEFLKSPQSSKLCKQDTAFSLTLCNFKHEVFKFLLQEKKIGIKDKLTEQDKLILANAISAGTQYTALLEEVQNKYQQASPTFSKKGMFGQNNLIPLDQTRSVPEAKITKSIS